MDSAMGSEADSGAVTGTGAVIADTSGVVFSPIRRKWGLDCSIQVTANSPLTAGPTMEDRVRCRVTVF